MVQPVSKALDFNASPISEIYAKQAKEALAKFHGHAVQFLRAIKKQNESLVLNAETASNILEVYLQAKISIDSVYEKLNQQLEKKTILTASDVSKFNEQVKKAEREIAKLIQNAQVNVAIEIGSSGQTNLKELRKKIEILARGGWQAKIFKFISTALKINEVAIFWFNSAKAQMEQASKSFIRTPDFQEITDIEKEKREEFANFRRGKDDLQRRAGVIGIDGVYRMAVTFNTIKKQLKSYVAQKMSDIPRKILKSDIEISGKTFTSQQIPLNKEFDEQQYLQLSKTDQKTVKVFGSIHGNKGISSLNRQEAHLINGWESNLFFKGEWIYRAIRHAITSDKHEKDPEKRRINSRAAAEELIKATFIQELSSRGLTLEDIKNRGFPFKLNLNSVSLVTPDDVFGFLKKGGSEKAMLKDQLEALQSFVGEGKFLEIDGVQIPIDLKVNAFNFGVNTGAVNFKMGTLNQYKQNLQAYEGLKEQVQALRKSVAEIRLTSPASLANKEPLIKNMDSLVEDINKLMASPTAYLKGDNMYEIGAKIVCLTNLMDRIQETYQPEKSGFKCSFNCMSGKDRTGIMDSVAKAYTIMAATNGTYPTHEQLQKGSLRDQYETIVAPLLEQSGGLEITELNTGLMGYKVTEHVIKALGISKAFFLKITRLSKLVSS